jgi:multimeric flavodoxin WrbA
MKALILLGTLKKKGLSNTEILSEFLAQRFTLQKVDCEIVKLVNHTILPGTYLNMGGGDEWPQIIEKVLAADILIFATPIWWGNHSSEMQRVIERLDELHDEILAGQKSRLEGKAGGIVVTGDSDGAQHVIANVANFFNAIGIGLPPYASLTVLSEKLRKGADSSREEVLEVYEKDYLKTADKMVEQLVKYVKSNA